MNNWLKHILIALAIIAALSSFYFSLEQKYEAISISEVVFLFILLIYHLILDEQYNKLLIRVLGLIIVSATFKVAGDLFPSLLNIFLPAANVFYVLALMVILIRIIKETEAMLVVNRYIWLIILIIAIDAYTIYEIIGLVVKFDLNQFHMILAFSYPVVMLVLLSAGLIYYLANANKTRRASFLVMTFLCFFLEEITEVVQYLYFFDNIQPGLTLLVNGFSVMGIWLFYMYCTITNVPFNEADS